jgi:acyl-CoA dehydrogenase
MDINPTPRAAELRAQLLAFMVEQVYPNETTVREQILASGDPYHYPDIIAELKVIAESQGLWNLFLPDPRFGPGLTNVEYAPLAEIMGRVPWASEVFNCSAPDTGNMEILAEFGTPEQQETWLRPLLAGEIRSCFSMTEPDVASSDARNIQSRITRDGDELILNGRKWWSSNAMHPNARLSIFMGVTDPDADVYRRQSMVLVPLDTPGVDVIRPLPVFGDDHGYAAHPEVSFTDVRVPVSNIIGEPGSGFAIAQARLGPGRVHHCMRLIGAAERGLELMIRRTRDREAFGKPLIEQGVIRDWVAESRMRIEQARLLVMKAAWMMDTVGKKEARIEISAIKVVAANTAEWVLDKAIQAHGGAGFTDDFPLAQLWASARSLRVADGPDEVHKMAIARREISRYD